MSTHGKVGTIYLLEVYNDKERTEVAMRTPYYDAMEAASKADSLEQVGWLCAIIRYFREPEFIGGDGNGQRTGEH